MVCLVGSFFFFLTLALRIAVINKSKTPENLIAESWKLIRIFRFNITQHGRIKVTRV